jgi:dienelactone hydrolase
MCSIALWAGPRAARAKLVEEVVQVSLKASNAYGKPTQQLASVTLIYEDRVTKPHPVAIINHGRAPKPEQRAQVKPNSYFGNARWLARMGFLVAVPVRLGYGATGGDDIEDSGSCDRKNYLPGYDAAAVQTEQVLQFVRERVDVAKDRTVVFGQSYGGTTAITYAAKNPPGVQAFINFAGGGGGNPETHAQQPCGVNRLKQMFAGYGETSRMPTLWVYTENDQWMGSKYPRDWFDAFKAAGGNGEFVLFPPHGKDGHGLFTSAPDVWRPKVFEFLLANGYPDLKPPAVPKPAPRTLTSSPAASASADVAAGELAEK